MKRIFIAVLVMLFSVPGYCLAGEKDIQSIEDQFKDMGKTMANVGLICGDFTNAEEDIDSIFKWVQKEYPENAKEYFSSFVSGFKDSQEDAEKRFNQETDRLIMYLNTKKLEHYVDREQMKKELCPDILRKKNDYMKLVKE